MYALTSNSPVADRSGESLEQFFRQNRESLLRYVRAREMDATEAEDICSEVWVRLTRMWPSIRIAGAEHAIMYTIARRVLAEKGRECKLAVVYMEDPASLRGDPAPSPEGQMLRQQAARLARRRPEGIRERWWAAYLWHVHGGETLRHIAARMNVPLNTVGSWVYQIRHALQDVLCKHGLSPRVLVAAT